MQHNAAMQRGLIMHSTWHSVSVFTPGGRLGSGSPGTTYARPLGRVRQNHVGESVGCVVAA
jgi:hypothetical protein